MTRKNLEEVESLALIIGGIVIIAFLIGVAAIGILGWTVLFMDIFADQRVAPPVVLNHLMFFKTVGLTFITTIFFFLGRGKR